jgi:maleylacetate reductase
MREFTHSALPMRVVFGGGRLATLAAELDALGLGRVLILSTPEQEALAVRGARDLGNRAAEVHARARMHLPVEAADRAVRVAAERGADAYVAVGGGSTRSAAAARCERPAASGCRPMADGIGV